MIDHFGLQTIKVLKMGPFFGPSRRTIFQQTVPHKVVKIKKDVPFQNKEDMISKPEKYETLLKVASHQTSPQDISTTPKSETILEVNECRKNELNIQMLSKNLYKQIFGSDKNFIYPDDKLIQKAQRELKKHNLWKEDINYLPDVSLNIPKLHGENIEEHFQIIGEQQAAPYKQLILSFIKSSIPKTPKTWILQKGWTKYVSGRPPESVPFPDEDVIIFDVEVCVKSGEAPTLATAVSAHAWYAWVCPELVENVNAVPKKQYSTDMMIPLEGKSCNKDHARIVIGHNVSYDRARVKEQYMLKNSALRFLDTMSLHICIGGITSGQRSVLKKKSNDENNDDTHADHSEDYLCANSLQDIYQFYCKKELSKETRNLFIEGSLKEIHTDFQEVMKYCASDVSATFEVLQKLTDQFFDRFPHPVTLAGMLELGTAYLPVNRNWNRYIDDSVQTYEDLQNETVFLLGRKCDDACRLINEEKYKEDLWMWDEDWSVQALKLTKRKVKEDTAKINTTEKVGESEMEWKQEFENDGLREKFKHLFDIGKKLPVNLPHLPGYPAWYRRLCNKTNVPDFVPGPQLVTTSVRVTPKILNLTWEGYPLFYKRELGWGILVADLNADPKNTQVPFEKLKALTIKNNQSKRDNNLVTEDVNEMREKLELSLSKRAYWQQMQKQISPKDYQGTGIWCGHMVDECCHFLKLPHKNGPSKNVGNPLARDFLTKFSTSTLCGSDAAAEKVLSIARMLSYWRNSRERIMGQLVVWLNKKEAGLIGLDSEETLSGAILPKVVVCGTLTRRAVEPTWMTASKSQEERIGSELRAMVQAPQGYHIVGADVDSQELWIASILGDSQFAKMHGATPFGWMTLSGTKASGTDMHSVTAKAAGISRDHAKVINYARIYGAGPNFAQTLLKQFNPSMTESEAKSKALKMFSLTKGRKYYRLKPSLKDEVSVAVPKLVPASSALKIAQIYQKSVETLFEPSEWSGGTESAMFNRLEEIANSKEPVTPFLGCRLTRALEPQFNSNGLHKTTRVNWVVQSGAVDFLHLMLVCMRWLTNGQARFCLSFHDEVRYLIPSEKRHQAALALHITNLLTRSFFARRVGLSDLPQSVAFFSAVEVDTALRKESNNDCVTASNPHGLEKGYGILPGESLDIYKTIELTGGTLSAFQQKANQVLIDNKHYKNMSQATKRKHVISEILQEDLVSPTEKQQIVKILESRGNNLHEVEAADSSTFLVSMPKKFRKNVWVKKGDFIVVDSIEEGGKVKAEMVKVVTNAYKRFLKSEKVWPKEFESCDEVENKSDDLFVNTNRKLI